MMVDKPMFPSLDVVIGVLKNISVAIGDLNRTIAKIFPTQTGSTSTSATGGSASALPAQPAGYVNVIINGQTKRIPFYD